MPIRINKNPKITPYFIWSIDICRLITLEVRIYTDDITDHQS
jgi:hypothetical protein